MSTDLTMEIPRMPDLWSKPDVIVTHKALAGALAQWAVRQSPYTVPDNLGAAVIEFMQQWPHADYERLDADVLKAEIRAVIERCALVKAWNEPKLQGAVNPDYGAAFVSRYETIKPDYDFIDLDALAHNVAHELTLWAQVEAAQDAGRPA
jgi:hypothetical protein